MVHHVGNDQVDKAFQGGEFEIFLLVDDLPDIMLLMFCPLTGLIQASAA